MICLGIESTAHTLGIGIINDKGELLSNKKHTLETEKGGIHPIKAAQAHELFYDSLIRSALKESKLTMNDIDLISFSQGPGLGQCLRRGAVIARSLSLLYNIPAIGVNHCVAHVEIGKKLCNLKNPVTLYTSGANTQIIAQSNGKYRIFGETMDIGVGNFLDNIGRYMKLGFPGGPKIEKLAEKGSKYIELPYTIKGMDFNFSGIQNKVKQLLENNSKEDICYSVQENVFAILVEATERAVAHLNSDEVLLTGGVAANKRLAKMIKDMCKQRGIKYGICPRSVSGDNGVMIAWQGILEYKSGKRQKISETEIDGSWRTDDVNITWNN